MKQPDKDLIESALQHSNMNLVETLLQDLRLIYPHDRDFYFYQCIYFLTIKQYEQAQNIITDCLRKFQPVMNAIITKQVFIRLKI